MTVKYKYQGIALQRYRSALLGLLLASAQPLLVVFGSLMSMPRKLSTRKNLYIFGLSLILLTSSIVPHTSNQYADWGIRLSFNFSLVAFVFLVQYQRLKNIDLYTLIRIWGAFHFLIVFLEMTYPDFKNLSKYISGMDRDLKQIVDYRSSGLYGGFDIAGIVFGLAACNELLGSTKKSITNHSRALFVTIFAFGAIMSSRTGIVIVLYGFCHAVLIRKYLRTPIYSLVLIFTIASIAVFTRLGMDTALFMFDFILNFISGGGLQNNSSRELFESHWIMPNITLFGSGLKPWEHGVRSDVGYVQIMDIFGIFGFLIIILIYASLFLNIYKINRNYFWLLPMILIINVKGAYFWDFSILFLIFFAAAIRPDKNATS